MWACALVACTGVGNHDAARNPDAAAERLAATWGAALDGGGAADVTIAYYALHLRPAAVQSAEDIDHVDDEVARLVLAWGVALGVPDVPDAGPGDDAVALPRRLGRSAVRA